MGYVSSYRPKCGLRKGLEIDELMKHAPRDMLDELDLMPENAQVDMLEEAMEIANELLELDAALANASMEKVEATMQDYMNTGDVMMKGWVGAAMSAAGALGSKVAPWAGRAASALSTGFNAARSAIAGSSFGSATSKLGGMARAGYKKALNSRVGRFYRRYKTGIDFGTNVGGTVAGASLMGPSAPPPPKQANLRQPRYGV